MQLDEANKKNLILLRLFCSKRDCGCPCVRASELCSNVSRAQSARIDIQSACKRHKYHFNYWLFFCWGSICIYIFYCTISLHFVSCQLHLSTVPDGFSNCVSAMRWCIWHCVNCLIHWSTLMAQYTRARAMRKENFPIVLCAFNILLARVKQILLYSDKYIVLRECVCVCVCAANGIQSREKKMHIFPSCWCYHSYFKWAQSNHWKEGFAVELHKMNSWWQHRRNMQIKTFWETEREKTISTQNEHRINKEKWIHRWIFGIPPCRANNYIHDRRLIRGIHSVCSIHFFHLFHVLRQHTTTARSYSKCLSFL